MAYASMDNIYYVLIAFAIGLLPMLMMASISVYNVWNTIYNSVQENSDGGRLITPSEMELIVDELGRFSRYLLLIGKKIASFADGKSTY